GASVSVDPASPQPPGTQVTFTVSPLGCAIAEHRFWLLPPGGDWVLVQNWTTSPTWVWDTSGAAPGTYSIYVGVRAQGADAAQASVQFDYTLSGGPCSGASLASDL